VWNRPWFLSLVLLLLTAVAGVLTYRLKPDDFAVSLVGGLFATGVTSLITLLIVDRLVVATKNRELSATRMLVMQQLGDSLRTVIDEFAGSFTYTDETRAKLDPAVALFADWKSWGENELKSIEEGLGDAMAATMEVAVDRMTDAAFVEQLRTLHTRVEPHLSHIIDRLLPAMYHLSMDWDLINAVVTFANDCVKLRRDTARASDPLMTRYLDAASLGTWRTLMGIEVAFFLPRCLPVARALPKHWREIAAAAR
jgi:hypothetical protein